MTGPEHYREAENLLQLAAKAGGDVPAKVTAAAQVHATLALAAATALGNLPGTTPGSDSPYGQQTVAWGEVTT